MSVADELKRLHDLHLAGGITAGEWARLKADLLGGTAPPAARPQGVPEPAGGPAEPGVVPLVRDESAATNAAPEPAQALGPPQPPDAPPGPPAAPPPNTARRFRISGPEDRRMLGAFAGSIASVLVFYVAVNGLVKLGVIPASWAAMLPYVGRAYENACLECAGTGKAKVKCGKCFGGGRVSGAPCAACGGTGSAEAACPKCAGSGKKSNASGGGAR